MTVLREDAGAGRGPRQRGGTGPVAVALAVVVLLLGMACTSSAGEEDVAGDPAAELDGPGVPDVPTPTEPAGAPEEQEAAGDPPDVPDDRPAIAAGPTVLVHLEGPLGNREATDVVVRTPAGEELDRFRLPGAIGVWAAPGASSAIIYTLPGGWARYDAASGRLSLVSFPGEVPRPTIRAGSGIAGETALWDPLDARLLLRMDSGVVTDLVDLVGDARLQQMTSSGDLMILQVDDEPVVVSTATGQARPLGPVAAGLSDNGLVLAMVQEVQDPVEGEEPFTVAIEAPGGGDRRTIGAIGTAATPMPLRDGRVVLLGDAPGIMAPDGGFSPLQPPTAVTTPAVVSADGTMALVTTAGGLASVDLRTSAVTPIPDTDGWVPLDLGPRTVLWASSVDPQAPGALVVDPESGVVTRVLDDRPTERFLSTSADGRRVTMAVGGEDGLTAVAVDADGTVTQLLEGPERVEAVLHPDGVVMALARIDGSQRSLAVGDPSRDLVEVATGRNPVWLSTVAPQGRPG